MPSLEKTEQNLEWLGIEFVAQQFLGLLRGLPVDFRNFFARLELAVGQCLVGHSSRPIVNLLFVAVLQFVIDLGEIDTERNSQTGLLTNFANRGLGDGLTLVEFALRPTPVVITRTVNDR